MRIFYFYRAIEEFLGEQIGGRVEQKVIKDHSQLAKESNTYASIFSSPKENMPGEFNRQ